ncbi:MAG: VOC family protein [Terriglobales bacterium]
MDEELRLPLGGDFALGPIAQIAVNARDLERAVGFYRDRLRLPLLLRAETMAFFDAGGQRIMLSLPERPEFDHPSSVLYFRVSDIRAGYQALVERGVHFVGSPHLVARLERAELWMAFFYDTEANLLALMSEAPLSSA